MKKLAMTLVAFAMATTMNAQWYVGGTFDLSFENQLIDASKLADGTIEEATGIKFMIKHEVGYNLNEKSSVGVVLGFGITNNGNEMAAANSSFAAMFSSVGTTAIKTDKSAIQLQISPYFRYKMLQFDKVDVFIDALFGFQYTSLDEWNNTTFNVGVRPGVAFSPNDKISFVAKLGKGLFFESSKDKDSDAHSKFGLNADTLGALEFGMYYNF